MTLVACYLYRLQRADPSNKETNLILEELPAVTEPFFLKVGPSFFSFTGSNCAYEKPKESCQISRGKEIVLIAVMDNVKCGWFRLHSDTTQLLLNLQQSKSTLVARPDYLCKTLILVHNYWWFPSTRRNFNLENNKTFEIGTIY